MADLDCIALDKFHIHRAGRQIEFVGVEPGRFGDIQRDRFFVGLADYGRGKS